MTILNEKEIKTAENSDNDYPLPRGMYLNTGNSGMLVKNDDGTYQLLRLGEYDLAETMQSLLSNIESKLFSFISDPVNARIGFKYIIPEKDFLCIAGENANNANGENANFDYNELTPISYDQIKDSVYPENFKMALYNSNTGKTLDISDTYNQSIKGYFLRNTTITVNSLYYVNQKYASFLLNTLKSDITVGNLLLFMRPDSSLVNGNNQNINQNQWYTSPGKPFETDHNASLFVNNTTGVNVLLYYYDDLNNPIVIPTGTVKSIKSFKPFFVKKEDGSSGTVNITNDSNSQAMLIIDGLTEINSILNPMSYKNSTGFNQIAFNKTLYTINVYNITGDYSAGNLQPYNPNHPELANRVYLLNNTSYNFRIAGYYTNIPLLINNNWDNLQLDISISTYLQRENISWADDVFSLLPYKLYSKTDATAFTCINYGQTIYNRSDKLIEMRYGTTTVTKSLDDVGLGWSNANNVDLYVNARCLFVRSQLTKITAVSTALTTGNKYYIPTTLASVKLSNTTGYDITLTYWDLQTASTTDIIIPDLSDFLFEDIRGLFNGACMFRVDRNCSLTASN
jgi:hypothetical protein